MAFTSTAVATNSSTATLVVQATNGQGGAPANLLIYNKDASITVYLGAADVDNAGVRGVPIPAGGTYSGNLYSNEKMYLMSASGTPSVIVQLNRV